MNIRIHFETYYGKNISDWEASHIPRVGDYVEIGSTTNEVMSVIWKSANAVTIVVREVNESSSK